ncbi:hypothetical protein M0R45_001088 [Rubus argutus]|uniref:Uncharacterized protein n=1 Tax=Rubus argutus TaxID=59490 RepID=A0AAW1VII0_RUBAR
MPATEFQGSSAGFNQFGRSVFSLKRHQLVNPVMEGQALDLETFQTHVADCFQHLSSPSQDLLSLHWLRDLLDGFLRIHEGIQARHPRQPQIPRQQTHRRPPALRLLRAEREGARRLQCDSRRD